MSELITAFIVDDEIKSISNLKNLIHKYCSKIEVIGSVQSPIEALDLINESAPDVLFLDIEMPKINGFELLNLLGDRIHFKVVFVTAYNQFAIKAIKVNALDYLLKPISIKDLLALETKLIVSKKADVIHASQLNTLMEQVFRKTPVKKLLLPSEDGHILEPLDNILYFKSENNYTNVYRCVGSVLLIAKTLKTFESQLPDNQFIRIHNSFLINISHIEKVAKHDGGYVVMKGGKKIAVSRRRMTNLQIQLKSTFTSL